MCAFDSWGLAHEQQLALVYKAVDRWYKDKEGK